MGIAKWLGLQRHASKLEQKRHRKQHGKKPDSYPPRPAQDKQEFQKFWI